ncbi:MAG: hypothetical protein ACP5XB_15105 [Isosphaeraceae bacterium]
MKDPSASVWWRRELRVSPAIACLVGLALGALLGILVAVPALDRVALFIGTFLALQGAVLGYLCWLSNDRPRLDRFEKTVAVVSLIALGVSLVAFPRLWWAFRSSRLILLCILGGFCGAAQFLVGLAWALCDLLRDFGSLVRRKIKSHVSDRWATVWDRELDLVPVPKELL